MIKFITKRAIEYCDDVRDGTHDSPQHLEQGYLLITSKNIKGYEIDFSGASYISKEDYEKINQRSLVEVNDILYSMIGTVGLVYRVERKPNYAIKNMGLFKVSDELKSKWLYYYLNSPIAKKEINSKLNGSTQKFISLSNLRGINIIYPEDINIQRKIVNVLETIDKKIKINNKINNNLLKLGLHQIELISNENTDILGNFATIISKGTTPTGKDMTENEDRSVKFIKVRDFNEYGINTMELEYIPDIIHKGKLKRSILAYKDLLISIAGTLGKVAIVTEELNNSNTNQAVAFIRLKDVGNLGYLYFYVRGNRFQREITKRQVHAVQPNLSLTELSSIDIPLIEKREKETFNVLLNKIISNLEMNNKLIQLRDTLLPKLMNGEIDLENIEL